ncbi:MAG: hypothetical protein ACE5KI_06380, partial [Dehalococcoidia bacterium]
PDYAPPLVRPHALRQATLPSPNGHPTPAMLSPSKALTPTVILRSGVRFRRRRIWGEGNIQT